MALSVTPTDEMKTLTVGQKIYEIVDDQAREDVSEVKADLSELEDIAYVELILPTPQNAWIRYSNGERVSSTATNMYVFTENLPRCIKAFLASDTNVLCAIAFYSTTTISTDSYMAGDSVDFASGLHNDGLWYEAKVPAGCQCIVITTKKPSETVADSEILFSIDSELAQIADGAETALSNSEFALYSPDILPSLDYYNANYIRYSDGKKIVTGSYFRVSTLKNNGYRHIKAKLYCGDTVPAMFAFYSAEAISEESYLKSASVQAKAGWANYEADIPSECVLIAITHRIDFQSGGPEYTYLYTSDVAVDAYVRSEALTKVTEIAFPHALHASFDRFKPCYDHLFVNKTGDNVVIPHESLYHVRISKALGFNCIEANAAKTSDGVCVVNHLASGKFGGYFHHVDGETDISDIALNSVTWDWVVENVRYNSQVEKYRTRPCRLEEFLAECKQQGLLPFLGGSGNADIVAIANKYMGKDNYIAYDGNRIISPNAIIYRYVSKATKEEILAYCESIGRPFIYGMANPTSFTDADLKDIVDTLHENGYWIGVSYADAHWSKYSAMGMDFNGTQTLVNRIETGNLHNLNTIFGFSDFTYSNGTESNGVLTFSPAGLIRPNIPDTTYQVCMVDVEIWFNGGIVIQRVGELSSNVSFTSDGTQPVFISIPIINGSPRIGIVAQDGTVVYDIKYKASVC